METLAQTTNERRCAPHGRQASCNALRRLDLATGCCAAPTSTCASRRRPATTRPNVLLVAVAAALVPLIVASSGQAEVVRFRMTGHITFDRLVGIPPDGIYEGAPFTVDLSYDTATPDEYPDDPKRGYYLNIDTDATNFLRFKAGPAEISADSLGLWVGNDVDGWPWIGDGRPLWEMADDGFQMNTSRFTANFPVPPFTTIVFRWPGVSRSSLDSDALPSHLELDAFDDAWITIRTSSTWPLEHVFSIRAVVTDVARVPEPTAMQLSMGFALCLARRRFQQRRAFMPYFHRSSPLL